MAILSLMDQFLAFLSQNIKEIISFLSAFVTAWFAYRTHKLDKSVEREKQKRADDFANQTIRLEGDKHLQMSENMFRESMLKELERKNEEVRRLYDQGVLKDERIDALYRQIAVLEKDLAIVRAELAALTKK